MPEFRIIKCSSKLSVVTHDTGRLSLSSYSRLPLHYGRPRHEQAVNELEPAPACAAKGPPEGLASRPNRFGGGLRVSGGMTRDRNAAAPAHAAGARHAEGGAPAGLAVEHSKVVALYRLVLWVC